jgi:hypothetical protein
LVVVQTVHLLQFFSGLWFFPALVSLCCVSVCTHTLFHAIGPLQVGRELYEKKKKGKNRGGQFHRFFFFFSLFDFFLSLTLFFWIFPHPLFLLPWQLVPAATVVFFIVSWRNANRPGFCSDREWGVMIYLPNAGPAAHYSCAGIRIRLWESGESTYLCLSHPGAAGSSLIYLPLSAEIEKKKKKTTDITLHYIIPVGFSHLPPISSNR